MKDSYRLPFPLLVGFDVGIVEHETRFIAWLGGSSNSLLPRSGQIGKLAKLGRKNCDNFVLGPMRVD